MRPTLRVFASQALVIVSLCFALGGCGRQTESEAGDAGQAAGSAPSAADQDQLALLPASDQAGSWKRTADEPRAFVAENLWEYINGGAEGYLVYDFQQVVTADYEHPEAGLQAVVDIYRMRNALCGFGIYSAERANGARFLEVGAEGYLTANALNFWKGSYYVKVTAYQEGERVAAPLEELARAVEARIGSGEAAPPELQAFPPEGLVPHSTRYLARDVLGQSELRNGFTADYKLDDREFKLFFVTAEGVEQSAKNYQLYKDFMQQYAKNLVDHSEEETPWFTAVDPYYGQVVTMRMGDVMLGVLGLDDPELVNEYLQRLQENLAAGGAV